MSLRRVLTGVFSGALAGLPVGCAVLACFAMSCARRPNTAGDSRPVGQVSVSITLEGGSKLDDLVYKISGNGIEPIVRRLNITKVFQSSQSFAGLPVGSGYTVSVDASSADGDVTCHAQSGFEVAVNQTAEVKLMPYCRLADA